ncbi:hypothetical protein [Xanthomonas maliensis]|nr:hypothetical protein [Xanthomonas maliensis]
MRLVRSLLLLCLLSFTVAWSAPTQADLPDPWVQAALLAQGMY